MIINADYEWHSEEFVLLEQLRHGLSQEVAINMYWISHEWILEKKKMCRKKKLEMVRWAETIFYLNYTFSHSASHLPCQYGVSVQVSHAYSNLLCAFKTTA